MKVLIISAHPDDETLGAGGTIFKHLKNNDEIYWYLATASDPEDYSAQQQKNQATFVEQLSNIFQIKKLYWSKFHTAKLDQISFKKIIGEIANAVTKVDPSVIYTPGNYDIHSDHLIIYKALLSAVKTFNVSKAGFRILSYEILSSTEVHSFAREEVFVPNVFSDITEFIDKKIETMEIIKDELQKYPLPRCSETIKALARFRGATAGLEYAEAFKLIFEKN